MKRIVNFDKSKGLETIIEMFDSFSEFTRIVDSRETVWVEDSKPARDRTHHFNKCDSFGDARELLTHGYNDNVKRLVDGVNKLQRTGTVEKRERFCDVAGYVPIVPRAVIGLPDAMLNSRKVQIKSKIVHVVYDCAVSWCTSEDEVLEFGIKFMNWCLNLERSGYRVKIDYLKCFNDDDRQYALMIPLKSELQPLNVKRLSFSLSHIAMQRYLSWDWLERLPQSREMYGFGTSLGFVRPQEKYRDNVRKFIGTDPVLICFGDDMDEIFGKVGGCSVK